MLVDLTNLAIKTAMTTDMAKKETTRHYVPPDESKYTTTKNLAKEREPQPN